MWPTLLDMTKEESVQSLRNLELEAYSSLISALRAQGPLNPEKRKLLKETGLLLSITNDRHKAEIRRAISDEKLNTIAYHMAGQVTSVEDWAQEGHRLVPLLPRVPPQTPYSVIADEASETTSQVNKQLPLPCNTERKRPSPTLTLPSSPLELPGKSQPFRVPDVPKEESKKRKISGSGEGSSLAQHLLGSSSGHKLSRIQQIYRQTSKPLKIKPKETANSLESEHDFVPTSLHTKMQSNQMSCSKINVIQNITLQAANEESTLTSENVDQPSNENQAPKHKTISLKPNPIAALKQSGIGPQAGMTIDLEKVRMSKKPVAKGQKLIVVSNAQTLPTSSILQKTLSVPVNKVTKLNLEKYKFVSNNPIPSTIQIAGVNSPHLGLGKHKVVTLKSNPGKKVIPLSHLQMLNSKGGIKVLPLSGKILGKNVSMSGNNSIYIPKTVPSPVSTINKIQDIIKTTKTNLQPVQTEVVVENGKSCIISQPQEMNVEKVKVEEVKQDFECKMDIEDTGNVLINDVKVEEHSDQKTFGGQESIEIHDNGNYRDMISMQTSTLIELESTDTSCDNSEIESSVSEVNLPMMPT